MLCCNLLDLLRGQSSGRGSRPTATWCHDKAAQTYSIFLIGCMSCQIFNRPQGNPPIFKSHPYQLIASPNCDHMTENKVFDTTVLGADSFNSSRIFENQTKKYFRIAPRHNSRNLIEFVSYIVYKAFLKAS